MPTLKNPAPPEVASSAIDRERAVALYRQMLLIRLCEEELARCHQRGLVHGACHTYVGQEAIAAGVCAHLTADDVVFSTHRGHGHALGKGVPAVELMAELFGREMGCSRGRGGSMHLFAPEVGLLGTSGIVGPSMLQAAGAAYSFRLLDSGRVAVAFFGDGAVNNGAFHEGLNMAGIWRLPVLFVCENNQFATEVPFAYSASNPSVASRGSAYGIASHELDGNDVAAIHAAAETAVAAARRGEGPTLLECKTYRTRAHAEGMGDFTYRTREDVQAWKERCPIRQWRQSLVERHGVSEAELDAIDEELAASIRQAREQAEGAPWPDPAQATRFIYSESGNQPASSGAAASAAAKPGGNAQAASPPAKPAQNGSAQRELTYGQATLEALSAAMAADPTIFVMGEGVGKRGGNFRTTEGLYDLYGPLRLCDTPICERGFVGMACGAAMAGARPIIDFMFTDFILDAMGEIINQIAKMQYMSSGRLTMPVLLRGCIGVGHSAATHHSGSYYGMYAQVPGLRVVVPSTPRDAKGLLAHALRCSDPVMFLEHRELLTLKGPVPLDDYEIEFGQAAIARSGSDLTVVALGLMVQHALAAAEQLAGEGISVEVVDPRTVLPLDVDTILESVQRTGRLLVVEEVCGLGGIAAEIAAQVTERGFDSLDAPIARLQGLFTPTPYSPPLEKAVVPDVAAVVDAIRRLARA